MSSPIRPEFGFNDLQSYAPRRKTPLCAVAPEIAVPSPTNLPPPGSLPFEGDVAIQALRRWLARDPEVVLQPPNWRNRQPIAGWTGTLSFIFMFTAIAVLSAAIVIFPDAARKNPDGVADLRPSLLEGMSRMTPSARLLVKSQKGFVNDPLPLGVSIKDASGGETVTLTGLAAGSNLSAATTLGLTGWRVTAPDLSDVLASAPKDFVGVMEAAINLRSARDQLLDSQVARLEWIERKEDRLMSGQARSTPQAMQVDITLMDHAEAMLKHGDIVSARLLLRRAANAGSAQAAFALGGTFDPAFLAEKGVLGFAPDVAQASAWYQRAMELGSTEASRRLERLATTGR